MIGRLRSRRTWFAAAFLLTVAGCFYVTSRLLVFAQLFGNLKGHSGFAMTQIHIAAADEVISHRRPAVVPRIIHQIFHDWNGSGQDALPADWDATRKKCLALNADWDHKLWNTESSRKFLLDNFAWFVPTYDSYRFGAQRVDSLRYFLLRHYGGLYLDLDNGCTENLTALTYYPGFTTDGGRGSLGSSIMGGQPGHPWFHLMTENLIPWNWNWVFPYVIINYCSGKWFATAMWERYHDLLSENGKLRGFNGTSWGPLHRILMDERPGADPWVYFTQERESGWQWENWDARASRWIGKHIYGTVLVVAAIVAGLVWCCVSSMVRKRSCSASVYSGE